MDIGQTRAIVRAALGGTLCDAPVEMDPVFRLLVPTHCEGVPREVLTPKSTWKDPQAYDTRARELAAEFVKNFEQFAGEVPQEIKDVGPVV